jgi:NAD(P)H-nitrite reductase large subunit
MRVHYLLRGDHYWSNVLDETESGIIEACLAEDRIQLHFHTELHELVGKKGRLQAVRVRSGQEVREIKASMLAIAIGIQPRKELAVKGGLKVDRGILVDDCLATSHAGIYAAGDVAQVYDPASQSYILDSLWSPAREQGRVAGLNMAGVETHYCKPPALNVTRLAGITTTIIGAVGRGRDADLVSITHGDSEAWRQKPDAQIAQHSHEVNRVRLLIGKSTLLGAIVMGEQSLSEPLKRIVSEQVDITPIREQLIQDQSRIKELILGFGGHNA